MADTTTTTGTKLFDAQLDSAGERAGVVAAEQINAQIRAIAYDPKFQQGIADKIAAAGATQIKTTYVPLVLGITFVMGLGAGYFIAARGRAK